MKLIIPEYVKKTINILNNNNFEAWIVGGSIRDLIMGKEPFDFDVATNARPEQVINLFKKTIPTGIKHGTVTVIMDDKSIEITTYRTDNGYSDSRHPASVSFVSNIKDDLLRRDFTVNAIAYNEKDGIFDPFGGINDINKKCLKTVGNAKERFNEDALRILRLFRFSSQLKFNIEYDTLCGAMEVASNLIKISSERVREELLKTLCGKNPFILNEFIKCGFLNFIGINNEALVPELLCEIPPISQLRLSYYCLINDIDISKICKSLKTSKAFMEECICICQLYKKPCPLTKIDIKKIISDVNLDYYKKYLLLYESVKKTNHISSLLSNIIEKKEAYKIDMLEVTGDDLKILGYKGREIGEKLNELLNIVIEHPEINNRKKLLDLL